MKKQQNNSIHAWALHVALALALLSISAVLLALSFKAAPARSGLSAPINPVAAGGNDLALAGPASAQSLLPADAPFTFSNTGGLATAREVHTATLLPNGKVLVAGGYNCSGTLAARNCDDPATGRWTPTGSLTTARNVTRRRCCPTARCWWQEDLIMATFFSARNCTTLPAGRGLPRAASTPHVFHTATLLPNGKVLVAGGDNNVVFLRSAELYDPASGTWTATGSLDPHA